MSCKINSLKTFFGILSLVFLPVFLSFFFLGTDTHAVSDITGTFNSSSPTPFTVCAPNSDPIPSCSDFNYLIISPVSPLSYSTNYYVALFTGNGNFRLPFFTTSIIDLNNGTFRDAPLTIGLYNFGSNSYTYTLTDILPSSDCPEPPPVEPCPEIPENPYDPKLDEITRAIYVTAGTLIVLYFFYCIYRLIIKNSGVH